MFLKEFVGHKNEVSWNYEPVFGIGDKVVLYKMPRSGQSLEVHGLIIGEVMAYHIDNYSYLIRFKTTADFPGWRYLTIVDDQAELVRDYDYSYVLPDPVQPFVVLSPLKVILERIHEGCYTPTYTPDHPDYGSPNPLVVLAVREAYQKELEDRINLFRIDLFRLYGYSDIKALTIYSRAMGERLYSYAIPYTTPDAKQMRRLFKFSRYRESYQWTSEQDFIKHLVLMAEAFDQAVESNPFLHEGEHPDKKDWPEEPEVDESSKVATQVGEDVDYHMPNNYFVG